MTVTDTRTPEINLDEISMAGDLAIFERAACWSGCVGCPVCEENLERESDI